MALRREGIGIKMDSLLPHLVVVEEDPLSTGITVYHLKVCFHVFSYPTVFEMLFCYSRRR